MKTQITIEEWRANLLKLKENSKFHNFWSNVSNIRVAKDADPKLVAQMVEASERVR